jgi:XRE family aerobic/anaerobic benzoate catabolism transcriptional regulator
VVDAKAIAKPRERAGSDVRAAGDGAAGEFATALGRLVRLGRAKRGITRRQLAQVSGTSERYLAQIESGAANPSVMVLRAIAEALDVPLIALVPGTGAQTAALGPIVDLLTRVPAAELPALAGLIEARVAPTDGSDRARRIALVGLRGAGKSTLGRMLAQHLGCPLVELDRVVERDYGASIPDLIEMAGIATFRRHERAALERVLAEHECAVITTAGGIVANPETYALLLRRAHTVWIKAPPEEHMSRVMAQGDFRPMAQNREAMADLVAILDARRTDYARAQSALDTTGETAEQSFVKLLEIVQGHLGGATPNENGGMRQ